MQQIQPHSFEVPLFYKKRQGETVIVIQQRENPCWFHITNFHSVQIITDFQGLKWHLWLVTQLKASAPASAHWPAAQVVQRGSRLHHSHLWLALSILCGIWSESPLAPWGNWKPQIIINSNSFVFLQPRIFETMWLSSSGVEEGAWKVWARTSHWPSVAENGVLFWTPLSQHEHYCWL